MQRQISKPGEKPRPILIRCRIPNTVDNEIILSKQKVLKDHPEWKNVVVKPDLTTNQPDYAKKQSGCRGPSIVSWRRHTVLVCYLLVTKLYYLGKKFIALLIKGHFMDKIVQLTCP